MEGHINRRKLNFLQATYNGPDGKDTNPPEFNNRVVDGEFSLNSNDHLELDLIFGDGKVLNIIDDMDVLKNLIVGVRTYTGTSVPANSLGKPNDLFFQFVNSILTVYSKGTTIWTVVGSVGQGVAENTAHRLDTTGNPHSVTKAEVGLGNVPNINLTGKVSALETFDARKDNPHQVSKSQVGLGNVPNNDPTGEINDNTAHREDTSSNPHNVTKAEVGLGNVPNTNFSLDFDKFNTHIADKTGNPHDVTKSTVGLGNVPNTNFTNKVTALETFDARTDNPHTVTKDQVGLGDVNNFSINAPTAADNGKFAKIKNGAFDYETVTIPTVPTEDINKNTLHREDTTTNPHDVDKADVGLGNVPNTNFTDPVALSTTHRQITDGNPHGVDKAAVGLADVNNVAVPIPQIDDFGQVATVNSLGEWTIMSLPELGFIGIIIVTTEGQEIPPNGVAEVQADKEYYLNVSQVSQVNVTTITDFTDTDIWKSVVSAGGSGSCTVESSVAIQSTNWKLGTTILGNSISFTQDNSGFRIIYKAGSGSIVALCGNTLSMPIPTVTTAVGDLSVTSITLDGTDITTSITTELTGDTLTVNYDTRIPNPNINQTNTFTIVANLKLGEDTVNPLTSTLTYVGPNPTLGITRNPLLFDVTYTSASISRSDINGANTSIDETIFGGVTQTAGATNITFSALNIGASVADRTLTEKRTYTNASSTSDPKETRQIDLSALLEPTFQYPVYLLSASKITGFTTAEVNASQKSGLFTSAPGDQDFTWNDPSDNSLTTKVLFVRNSFRSETIMVFAYDDNDMRSPIGATVPLAGTVAVGNIAGQTETYSFYIIATGQPGGIKYHVDF